MVVVGGRKVMGMYLVPRNHTLKNRTKIVDSL